MSTNYNIAVVEKSGKKTSVRITISGFPPTIIDGKPTYRNWTISLGPFNPKDWDAAVQRPTKAFSKRDGGMFHRSVEEALTNALRAFAESPAPKDVDQVKERYHQIIGKVKGGVEKKRSLILELADSWIAESNNASSINSYTVFRTRIDAYEKEHKTTLDLLKMSTDEVREVLEWSIKKYALSPNSAAGVRKHLNKAIHIARANGATLAPVKGYQFVTPKKEILDWQDIATIIAYNPMTESEAAYKTILLAFLFSSVRISDIWQYFGAIKLRGGILCSEFEVSKDPHPTISPIVFEPVRAAIELYGMPKYRSEQHVRKGIHELISAAGIRKHVECHSLRRSFVSNFLSLGTIQDALLARVFTGHSMKKSSGRIFHAYDHNTMSVSQRTVCAMLKMTPPEYFAGITLLSDQVCPGMPIVPMFTAVREAV